MPKVYLKYDETGKPKHEIKVNLPKSWCKSKEDGGKAPAEVVKLFTESYNKKYLHLTLQNEEHTLFGPPEPSHTCGRVVEELGDACSGISYWIRAGQPKGAFVDPPAPPQQQKEDLSDRALTEEEIKAIVEECESLVLQDADEPGSAELYPKSIQKDEDHAHDQANEYWKLSKYRLGLGQHKDALGKVNLAVAITASPSFLNTRAQILLLLSRPHAALADTEKAISKMQETSFDDANTDALTQQSFDEQRSSQRNGIIAVLMLKCRALVALGRWIEASAAADEVRVWAVKDGSGGSPRSTDIAFNSLVRKVKVMASTAQSAAKLPQAEVPSPVSAQQDKS